MEDQVRRKLCLEGWRYVKGYRDVSKEEEYGDVWEELWRCS